MLHLWNFFWLFLHVLLGQYGVQGAESPWPLSNFSNIQLLGMFSDKPNASASESTTSSVHSCAMFQAAMVLSQQYNITIDGQFLGWQITQTGGDIVDALSDTCHIMANSYIVGIVGPAFSREAHVIAPFAEKVGLPVISYAATDPELSDRQAYPAFYRTVPSDNEAAVSIVKLFNRFNWTSCIIIYQNDAFGSGGADAISEAFNDNNLTVSETLVFEIAMYSFRGDLKSTLMSISTRIVLVWADEIYTSSILQHALDSDVLGPQFLWILSSTVPLASFNQTLFQKLIGILSLEPVVGNTVDAPVNTTLLNAAYDVWRKYEPKTFPESSEVDYYALFAFDAAWSLIQSLQQLCATNANRSASCFSVINSSFCFNRRFQNANLFFQTIGTTEFLGVSGPVQFGFNVTDRTNGTYYIVKNIQLSSNALSFMPVLEWSNSGDWKSSARDNAILWLGSFSSSPTGVATLSGIRIKIGVFESPPFTMIVENDRQTTTNLTGFVPDLINLLQTRIGFIPEIILAPSNHTYGGMVRAVANGVYDIVIGDVTVTAQRREIVDFSAAIYDNSMRLIVRQTSSESVDLFSYLKPFSNSLWLALFASCVFAAALACLLEREENEALQNKSLVASCSLSMWYSFGTLMGYGADFQAKTAAGRLLSVGLYILSLILVATYTANLASNLTISKSQTIISGIDDIKNGRIPSSRVGVIADSSFEDYYLRSISDGVRNFYPLKTDSDLYSSLLNNVIDASFMDTGNLEYATNTLYCNLTLVGTDFAPSSFAIVVPKQWIYLQTLDVNILSLRESGSLDDLKRKWFAAKTCSDTSASDSNTATSIDLTATSGLFLTFAIISILSLLLFLWSKRIVIKRQYLRKLLCQQNLVVEPLHSPEIPSSKV